MFSGSMIVLLFDNIGINDIQYSIKIDETSINKFIQHYSMINDNNSYMGCLTHSRHSPNASAMSGYEVLKPTSGGFNLRYAPAWPIHFHPSSILLDDHDATYQPQIHQYCHKPKACQKLYPLVI